MSSRAALLSFVEEELARMVVLASKVVDDTLFGLTSLPPSAGSAERFKAIDLAMSLRSQRQQVASAFVEYLQQLRLRFSAEPGAPQRDAVSSASAGAGPDSLRLVGEDEHSAALQIARCTEQIKEVAEFEFRKFSAFLSALGGDMQVTVDHTPFEPEFIAHALWAAAQCLPEEDGMRAVFMSAASAPLAQEMRRAYAASCSRLQDAGVRPAVYSNVSAPSGTAQPQSASRRTGDEMTNAFAQATVFEGLDSGTAPADLPADPQYLGLLNRLFELILADPKLAPDVKSAMARLQAPAAKLAHTDDTLLDTHDHPMWLLLDRIAWQAELLPEMPHPARSAVMQTVGDLVDQLAAGSPSEVSSYQTALNALLASERQRFDQRRHRLTSMIDHLEALALQTTQPMELSAAVMQALDTGHLDTVPSQLPSAPPSVHDTVNNKRRIPSMRPGHMARLYLSNQWVNAQLMWVDAAHQVFLWADCRSDASWPIKRTALAHLQAESLALAHEPRRLVRAAARLMSVELARGNPS